MEMSHLIIGVLLLAIVTTGFMTFYTDLAHSAGVSLGPHENLTSFRATSALINFTNTTYGATASAASNLPFADLVGFMVNGFNALKMSLMSLNIVQSVIFDAATILGVPPTIAVLLWVIVIVIAVYALIHAITGN